MPGTTQARLFRMALAELGDPDINPRVTGPHRVVQLQC